MHLPNLDPVAFTENFDAGKSQLFWQWLPADLETPVSAYLKLCKDEEHAILLESIEGGKTIGRYSAIGFAPDLLWKCENKQVAIKTNNTWQQDNAKAIDSLENHIQQSKIDIISPHLPPMAPSGLFGMLGYDMVRLIENIPDRHKNTLNIPDSLLMRPTIMLIFDHVFQMMCLVTPVRAHHNNSEMTAQNALQKAGAKLLGIIDLLNQPLQETISAQPQTSPAPKPNIRAHTSKDEYCQTVETAKEYIRAGDIFQVVPSIRFEMDFNKNPFKFYRSLRRLNPSPFLFHLKFKDFSLTGSSPEILVRVRNKTVTIRPIAGTRKRGATTQEDNDLAESLLNDTKECAEHLMLLDLGRNDVGRVCEIGSLNVTEKFIIERYSHVMHIVSNVEGRLREDQTSLNALFSGFPAGTVSGAPKIRAMEIIDELEPSKRGFYGGCVGYFDGHGDVDSCIALRTALHKDGKLYIQAGAGIVADSDPASEYQECCNKAQALIEAARQALID